MAVAKRVKMTNITHKMPVSNWTQPYMQRVQGITIHYAAGNPVSPQYNNEDQLIAILQSYARYHIANIPNDSIAYTYVVDKWGFIYQTRELRQSYHTNNIWGNQHTLGILCPLGSYEEPTKEQVRSLFEIVNALRVEYAIPASNVVGHQELSNTPCPGKLMPYVLEYRNGTYKPEEPEEPEEDTDFTPGWYRVVHNGKATIREQANTNSRIILTLPSDYREYIHAKVKGQQVADSGVWYQTMSDYGKGYIHSSGIYKD
jgi:hypothetical protein